MVAAQPGLRRSRIEREETDLVAMAGRRPAPLGSKAQTDKASIGSGGAGLRRLRPAISGPQITWTDPNVFDTGREFMDPELEKE